MNVEIGTETPIFLFWEFLFRKFGVLSLQCVALYYWLPMRSASLLSRLPRCEASMVRQGLPSLNASLEVQ
jgi:hypothetical protein